MLSNFKGYLFIFRVFSIFLLERLYYFIYNDYPSFINRLTHQLAKINILYVKIFQAIALNNQFIDEKTNEQLMNFTDKAPWSHLEDIDLESIAKLAITEKIYLKDGCYQPINTGMISLVYKTYLKPEQKQVIIKIKRKNIETRLNSAIDDLMFLVNILSFFPSLSQYKIDELVRKNIDIIRQQVHFEEEVKNMIKIKENCKNLKYVKIPEVYPEITEKYPNLIMMEYIEGLKINEIAKDDYEGFARQILKFGFVTTNLHGFTHGDLHAGNILFIKDLNNDTNPYKIGVLDFGIMFDINENFKNILFELTSELFDTPTDIIAKKMIDSGIIIQPLETIWKLPKEHYQYIIDMGSKALNETLYNKGKGNHFRMYDFISNLHSYINEKSLFSMGLYLSDDFVKTQLVLAMSHGVTMKLCKENYMELANQTIDELFHVDFFE